MEKAKSEGSIRAQRPELQQTDEIEKFLSNWCLAQPFRPDSEEGKLMKTVSYLRECAMEILTILDIPAVSITQKIAKVKHDTKKKTGNVAQTNTTKSIEKIEREISRWINPYDVSPYDVSPYDVNPYDVSPYDVNPYDVSPYAVNPYDRNPYELNTDDIMPYAVNPYAWLEEPLKDLGTDIRDLFQEQHFWLFSVLEHHISHIFVHCKNTMDCFLLIFGCICCKYVSKTSIEQVFQKQKYTIEFRNKVRNLIFAGETSVEHFTQPEHYYKVLGIQ